MTNIRNLDVNKTKIDEKSYKIIFIYYIGYVACKDFEYIKNNSVNVLYLTVNKINGYFDKISENKYLTLLSNDESKEIKIYMKNCGVKLKIKLEQKPITQMIMMKNI